MHIHLLAPILVPDLAYFLFQHSIRTKVSLISNGSLIAVTKLPSCSISKILKPFFVFFNYHCSFSPSLAHCCPSTLVKAYQSSPLALHYWKLTSKPSHILPKSDQQTYPSSSNSQIVVQGFWGENQISSSYDSDILIVIVAGGQILNILWFRHRIEAWLYEDSDRESNHDRSRFWWRIWPDRPMTPIKIKSLLH